MPIGAPHDGEEKSVPFRAVRRQIAAVEHDALARAAAHEHGGNALCFQVRLRAARTKCSALQIKLPGQLFVVLFELAHRPLCDERTGAQDVEPVDDLRGEAHVLLHEQNR